MKSPARDVIRSVGMALPTGLRQVEGMDRGARVTTGQDFMILMATDTVGALENPKFYSNAMKALLKRFDLFDGDATTLHDLDIGMTARADIGDVLRVERRTGIIRREEIMLTMTI